MSSPIADSSVPSELEREEWVTDSLCSNCEGFDLHSFSRDPRGLRGYSLIDTKEGARSGCSFCSLLLRTFRRLLKSNDDWSRVNLKNYWFHISILKEQNWLASESGGEGLGIDCFDVTLGGVNYRSPLARHREIETSEKFHVVADPNDPAYRSGDICRTYTAEDTGSNDYLHEIKRRMDICLTHTTCCETLSGHRGINSRQVPLPRRCIDVQGQGLQIAETESLTSSYVILSHRWTPQAEACATTTENIELRRQGDENALLSLPKTFCDVFNVARGLGIRYVWIDSLCIIQRGDGGEDWSQEAPKMGDYYQQAILTICATSGSSDQGLFPVLTGHVPDIARLRYRDKKGIPQGFFYVYPYGDPRSNRQTEEEAIRASELFTRGWVFQEWILSRRRVYFTPAGMIYDCETTGLSNNHREVWGSKKNYGGRIFERYFSGHRIAIDWWYWLLELYTEKSLTQPEKDRIVALKGIAEEFRELLKRIPSDSSVLRTIVPTVACGLEYLSGLWAYDLHRGLLWQRVSFAGRHQRLPLYPSWSWTAVVGPVEWPSNPAEKRVGGFRARLSSTSSESTLALHPQAKLLVARVGNGASLIPNDDLGTADRFQTVPIDAFGTLNKSATLQLAGKLVRVLIREEFSGERDHEILSNICGEIADTQSARTFWRKVCTTSVHTEVIGWASIDDPSFQEDSMYGSGLESKALVIATSEHKRGYGLGFYGLNRNGNYTVYHVLFVREIPEERFERIGVGQIFGKEVEEVIRKAGSTEVNLV